jgi:hypothetical protein
MVLDSPPFPSGNGWGMSLHRWETPSKKDIQRGRTWSDRIPINAYPSPPDQDSTLDDKNTMAVNNAGRDHDGKIGIMVACWGQNYDLIASARQQIVCERSTNGGRSWPDAPQRLSALPDPALGFGPFVIGVHVVASERDPNTFYAVWMDTLSGFLDGSLKYLMEFTKTTDGAQTWQPARVIARVDPLPNTYPRQSFRNLTLPIMAAGRRGELYVSYSDYTPATFPDPDIDGFQADVKLIRSLDDGATWTSPARVNQDTTNADQFQPYLRVTPRGQVNVSYFDRRLDVPQLPTHPGNFFIDTFLSRSNDGGSTWQDTRVSHDAWDPSINPPISGSGEFIGDYQGLVADDCFARPFVNDTHLANDPRRDPDFDRHEPRSPFQEIVAWQVPNTKAFGGAARQLSGRDCRGDDEHGGYARVDDAQDTHRAVTARLSRRAVRAAHDRVTAQEARRAMVIGERAPGATR